MGTPFHMRRYLHLSEIELTVRALVFMLKHGNKKKLPWTCERLQKRGRQSIPCQDLQTAFQAKPLGVRDASDVLYHRSNLPVNQLFVQ